MTAALLLLPLAPAQSRGRTTAEAKLYQLEEGLLFVMEDLAEEIESEDFEPLRLTYERELDRCAALLTEVQRKRCAHTDERHRRIIASARRARGLICDPEDVVLQGVTL